ncbi:hypothetical protein PMAYCL1PPCAC_29664, partial [Pristionchus mayeri]
FTFSDAISPLLWRIHIIIRYAILWIIMSKEYRKENPFEFPEEKCGWKIGKKSEESRVEKGEVRKRGSAIEKKRETKDSIECRIESRQSEVSFIVGRSLQYHGRQLYDNYEFQCTCCSRNIFDLVSERLLSIAQSTKLLPWELSIYMLMLPPPSFFLSSKEEKYNEYSSISMEGLPLRWTNTCRQLLASGMHWAFLHSPPPPLFLSSKESSGLLDTLSCLQNLSIKCY